MLTSVKFSLYLVVKKNESGGQSSNSSEQRFSSFPLNVIAKGMNQSYLFPASWTRWAPEPCSASNPPPKKKKYSFNFKTMVRCFVITGQTPKSSQVMMNEPRLPKEAASYGRLLKLRFTLELKWNSYNRLITKDTGKNYQFIVPGWID